MAYMNMKKKKALAPAIKAVLKKYGMKGTLAMRHHSTLILNLKSGPLDILTNYARVNAEAPAVRREKEMAEKTGHPYKSPGEWALEKGYLSVNPYWIEEQHTGRCGEFLKEVSDAMNGYTKDATVTNHDNSDIMTDYFDVGWYIEINVGAYGKPYEVTA